jgi:hypothetical protein
MKTSLLIPILLLSLLACKSSTPKEVTPEPPSTEIKGIADSLHGRMDTTVNAPIVEQEEKVTSKPHITDHICNLNFTLLAKPDPNRQLFYISGFNHEEFKCWEEIQNHATKICGDQACTIYYVDMADVKVIPSDKDLLDPTVLKEHGIAKFNHNGKYWDLNGSAIWKRKGNGWSYYTTNNQFGG